MKLKQLIIIAFLVIPINAITQNWQQNLEQNRNTDNNLNFYQIQKAFNDYWEPFKVKNGKYVKDGQELKAPGWKLYKRWEWYWEPRINKANGEFPETTTAEQWKKYMASPHYSTLKSSSGTWTSAGPSASSGGYAGVGRINCISFHPSDPNTFWVGSPSGGLWKTTNGGSTWTVLTDNNTVLGVSDIAIPSDFASSNTMYIATGDRDGGSVWSLGGGNSGDNNSIGFLKSTNGGSTWSPAGSFDVGDGYISGFLRIHPNNNSILYGGMANVIFKSTDGAASWGTGSPIYSFPDFAIDFEFHPAHPDTIYVATQGGSPQIYRSIDAGANWINVLDMGTSDRRIELAISPNDSSVVYAAVTNSDGGLSGIYKSTDHGGSFTEVFDGDAPGDNSLLGYYSDGSGNNEGQGNYDLALAVSPSDVNTLYLGGINTWKSSDGGVTWVINNMWTGHSSYNKSSAPVAHADKHVLKFQNSSTLFEGNDGGVYKTTDGGTSWTDLTNGMSISQIYRLGASATSSNTVITGLQDNGSKLYNGGGWTDVTGGDGMECLIDYTDNNIQYGTYINGQISRTTNMWGSSTDIYTNIGTGDLEGHWVTPYIIDPTDHATIYVGYQDVWKSTDMGDTFEKISTMNTSDDLRSMAIAPSDNQVIYVADRSTIWVTNNGGASWTDVTGTLPVSSDDITYLTVHASDPNTVWATFGGYSANHVYESTNGGSSWTNISTGLPSLPVFCIVQNKLALSENHLYVGTDRGVYLKAGSANWTLFSSGLPNVMVTELDIYYDESTPDNSILYAATYGRGLWKSDLKELPTISVDAGVFGITYPEERSICGETVITPTVRIKNNGTDNITGFTLAYSIDGGSAVSTPWTGSLATGEVETVSFSDITLTVGSHTFTATLSNVNGGTDVISVNDSKSVSYTISDNNFSFPISEGFNASSIPGCWSQETVTDVGGTTPELSFVSSGIDPTVTPYEGTHMVKFNSFDADPGGQIRLISPAFSTVDKSQVTVGFQWYESGSYSNLDSVTIQWSTDGSSWNYGQSYSRFVGGNEAWEEKSYTLPADAENQSTLYVGLMFTSQYGMNCYLDDFEVTAEESGSITTGTISGAPFNITEIAGESVEVPYTVTGTFTSNTFTAYLSDASGDFSSETAIGNLVSNTSGTISASIPPNTPSGTAYKIRIKSNSPEVIGSESNAIEIVLDPSTITIGSITGSPFNVTSLTGASISIPYTTSGGFVSNTFTAYLSDATGDFSSETAIGNLVSNTSGTISGTVPANIPSGTTYKVRVKSSNPTVVSSESNTIEVVLDPSIITTGTITGSPFNITSLSGTSISIPYTISGGFVSNTFTAYLSDASGNFSTETAIGSLVSNDAGVISGTIPPNRPSSTGYKVRIKASNPAVVGSESNSITISFSPSTITTGIISGSPFNITSLTGTSISIPYTVSGEFASNTFTAYLSNASGNFSNETAIGSLTSNGSGIISGTIPANRPSGTGYKIRIKSSNPSVMGSASNNIEIILDPSTISIGTISGSPFEITSLTGTNISIPYTVSGEFASNTFTAYLTDASGSTTNEVAIGSLVSNEAGVIMCTIPPNKPSGNGYRVRIKANNPDVTSVRSSAFEIVLIPSDIFVSSITGSPFSVTETTGTPIDIPYTITGAFVANTFTAYLSNSSGSFYGETAIGSLVSDEAGVITGMIPPNSENGSDYKIRVKSSSPAAISPSSNKVEIILRTPFIQLGSILGGPFKVSDLMGANIEVAFSALGEFSSNVFTAYLSDASGDFSNETLIGSLNSDAEGIISVTIPASTPSGTKYRIRVKSSNEYLVSSVSNKFEIIYEETSLTTGVISDAPFSVSNVHGFEINVPYTVTGAFDSNTFSAYLSDASGSFTSETLIGSLYSETDGTILAIIPANTPSGSAYKIRVKSSNPLIIGTESNTFTIEYNQVFINTGTILNGPFYVSDIEGRSIDIPFISNASFSSNTFTAYLSDASGDFSSETVIGTFNSDDEGSIPGIIPSGTSSGTGYKIRVKSNSPAITGTESDAFEIIYDNEAPTVTVSSQVSDPTNVSPIELTVTFSEEIMGFDLSKVTVGNGTLDNFNIVSTTQFSLDVTPITDGLLTGDIVAGAVTDIAGNPNIAATQWNTTYIFALGIEELKKVGVTIYPNPTSNNLTVKLSDRTAKVSIWIIDLTGKIVDSIELLNSNEYSFEVSSYAKGTYIIRMHIDGKLLSAQFMVR